MIRLHPPAVAHALTGHRAAARQEDGFILLESIVALSLMSIILAALGTFALNSITQTNYLRSRQAATQVATTAMTTVDSLPTDDLLTGRDDSSANTALNAQWKRGSALADVKTILDVTNQASSSSAAAGAGDKAAVSTSTQTVKLNNIVYSFDTYVGTCLIATGTSDCVKSGASGITHDRIVVWVTWAGQDCPTTGCVFATSSLINPDADPIFNTNKSTPPSSPIVVSPGDQSSTVNKAVTLNMTTKAGTGVNPITWSATGLPLGLTIDQTSGTITGSPQVTQNATQVTVTATDAFTRTGSTTFNWTVFAAPAITTPAAQNARVGTSTSLTPTYTCANTACTFSAANLPAGLSINTSTGVVSGTPTTAGVSSVTITVTDNAQVSATTNTFTWTVTAARPTVASPGTQAVTIGQNVSVAVAYTCPTPSCTIRLTGTIPNGVGLSTSASTTGNNTATQLTGLTATSGTIYLAGTVQGAAVTTGAGSKAYAPTLTITDATPQTVTSATGAWTAYEAPTISALAAKTVRTLETSSVALTYTCPISSCTFTLTGTVPSLGLATTSQTTGNPTTTLTVTGTSGTVYYTGKVDSAAPASGYSGSYNPKITVADSNSVGTSTTATYTVNKAPAITNPGSQAMNSGQNLSLQMQYTCPNGGCTNWALAVQINNDPNYYGINGNITNGGLISYNNTPAGTYNLRVTVTDSAGQTDTIYFTLKVVSAMSVDVPDQTTSKPSSGSTVVTVDVSKLVNPTADGYVYSLSGQPGWLSIDATTGLMTATITSSSATDTSITVTVQSKADGSGLSKATDTFSWTIR